MDTDFKRAELTDPLYQEMVANPDKLIPYIVDLVRINETLGPVRRIVSAEAARQG
jgi:hypothetical protein